MSWLRIDDGFALHPKVVQLTDRQFRLWMRLLCWCARYQTKGLIPPAALAEFRVRGSDLTDFAVLGLVETQEDQIVVHDWNVYAPKDPTAAERVRRNRANEPRVSPSKWEKTRELIFERDHGICIDCGKADDGTGSHRWNADHEQHRSELVAQGISIYDADFIVTRCHSCHSKKTRLEAIRLREQGTEPGTEPAPNHSVTSSLAPPRGRDPSSSKDKTEGLSEARPDGNGIGFAIDKDLLRDIG